MNLNRVFLAGNCTRDVELKHTQGGHAVANLGIAINRKFKVGDETREDVVFVDLEAWGATAENLAKFFGKGKPIFVEGRLKLDQWEKDGQKFSKLRVVVERFEFIGAKGEGEAPRSESSPRTATRTQARPAEFEEDIVVPF